jgi:hypothetical protein
VTLGLGERSATALGHAETDIVKPYLIAGPQKTGAVAGYLRSL